ncbi:phosphohistidine phosphatase SixA [soil metagenome]
MILVYVRHAVAMDRDAFAKHCIENGIDADDELRPLTVDGKRKMKKNAEGLVEGLHTFADSKSGLAKPKPLIVSSPLVRAVDTAGILAAAFGKSKAKPDATTEALSPGRSAKEFRDYVYDLIHSRPGRTHVNTMVIAVGHEPSISSAIGYWMIGKEKSRFPLKKGAATCLEIGNALAPGEARLLWSLPPWALRALAK